MGNIAVGGEYFPILWDHFIHKGHIKTENTVDVHHETDVVGGCYVES